ncbi:hypothetical protein Desgi_3687 [Desulfoscipio gibsoniae DSM 7213]|uniref:DUF2292 domain-containing protein n=1 Tax=Desulfoscipio gibsoniae DSM 7213 TaxID=767817 RepID=R4KK57_9FIRM|nr:hypothetical protein Desgi_3687 [Desulfoscipio gibsoniae DSM 7213]
MPLSNTEKQLIKFLRAIGWGEVRVRIENGKPVLICEAIRTFKLDDRPSNLSTRSTSGPLTG